MSRRRRVLFVDGNHHPVWGAQPNRFRECAQRAGEAGFEVTLLTAGPEAKDAPRAGTDAAVASLTLGTMPYPLVCGRERALETHALRASYTLAQTLAVENYDVVVTPLRGGLAHGLLMQRATGERVTETRFALWCDAPSRCLALRDDASFATTEPLVSDALERTTVGLADVLLAPSAAAVERLQPLARPLPQTIPATLDIGPNDTPPPDPAGAVREIVFVGPLSRANGALLFMDAVESIGAQVAEAGVHITFLGPMVDDGPFLSQALVGLRAQGWRFAFQLRPSADRDAILSHLRAPGRLGIFMAEDDDDDRLLRSAARAGCPLIASRGYDATRNHADACGGDVPSLTGAIVSHLRGTAPPLRLNGTTAEWPSIIEEILARPTRQPFTDTAAAVRSASVCSVTRDRLDTAAEALRSIGTPPCPTEVLLLDNARDPPIAAASLELASGPNVTLIRSPWYRSPASAYNHAAAAARGDALVFLDDDNVFTPDGLGRFVAALNTGWFDIVVTTLDLVDGNAATGASAGRAIFLGEAGSAGLFFNGFGDRALAIRRDVFLRLGGFPDPGYHAPVSDWAFLAKAQSAGLSIGVLQAPAVRYARRLTGTDTNWLKRDRDGGRRAVLEAYGGSVDGPFVARLTQGLQLRSG